MTYYTDAGHTTTLRPVYLLPALLAYTVGDQVANSLYTALGLDTTSQTTTFPVVTGHAYAVAPGVGIPVGGGSVDGAGGTFGATFTATF